MDTSTLRYDHLREQIGAGGSGVVYKAFHPEHGLCAVKIVQPERHNLPGIDEEFQRELENQKCIAEKSQYAVAVLEQGKLEGIPYGVMPFVPYSLKQIIPVQNEQQAAIIANFGFNQNDEFLMWLLHRLAAAIADLHKYAVHGDLKPSNILLDPDSTPQIRLADFGLLKMTSEVDRTNSVNAPTNASLAGTYLYMAPELFEGAESTQASDMYAFGVTAWQLIYGQLPFPWVEDDTVVSYARRKNVQFPFVPYRTKIPEGVRQVLMSALRVDPLQRIRSATRFADEIERAWRSPSQFYFRDPPPVWIYVVLGYVVLLGVFGLFVANILAFLAG